MTTQRFRTVQRSLARHSNVDPDSTSWAFVRERVVIQLERIETRMTMTAVCPCKTKNQFPRFHFLSRRLLTWCNVSASIEQASWCRERPWCP